MSSDAYLKASEPVDVAITGDQEATAEFVRVLAAVNRTEAKVSADRAARRAEESAYDQFIHWGRTHPKRTADHGYGPLLTCLGEAYGATRYLFLAARAIATLGDRMLSDPQLRDITMEQVIPEHVAWFEASIGTARAIVSEGPAPAAKLEQYITQHIIEPHATARRRCGLLQDLVEP